MGDVTWELLINISWEVQVRTGPKAEDLATALAGAGRDTFRDAFNASLTKAFPWELQSVEFGTALTMLWYKLRTSEVDEGMSAGELMGIVVGAIVALLCIGLLAGLLLRFRSKRHEPVSEALAVI